MKLIYSTISYLILLCISVFVCSCSSTFSITPILEPVVMSDIVGINKTILPTGSIPIDSIKGVVWLSMGSFFTIDRDNAISDFNGSLKQSKYYCVPNLTIKVISYMEFLGMGVNNEIVYSGKVMRLK